MCEVNVKLQRDDLIAAHFDVGKCPHLMFGCRYDHGGRTYTPVNTYIRHMGIQSSQELRPDPARASNLFKKCACTQS